MVPPVDQDPAGNPAFAEGVPSAVETPQSQVTEDLNIVQDNEKDEYPDGGMRAWLVVLGAWCAMVPSMGLLNTMATLQAWLLEHDLQGVPESKVGWIFSCYAFFLYFCGAQVGPIFDSQNVKVLLIPGSVGIVLALIMFSLSSEFYQYLLSFGVLGGMSASLLFNPSLAAIGHWFLHRRGLATGIACTAGGLGGVWFPLMVQYLAPKIGFPWAVRAVALVCAVLLGLACVLLRQRLPRNSKAGAAIDIQALRDPKFATATVATFLIEFAVFIPYTFITSYAIYVGMDSQSAYLLNALVNAGAVPGRVLPGYVADKVGVYNTMCVTSAVCAAFIFGLWQMAFDDTAKINAFAVLFGFWSGAAISLTSVCIAQVCKVEDIGKRIGTAFFMASFGALIGIPIAGVILEANNGEYRALILFGGAMYALSCAFWCLARFIAGRRVKRF